MLLLLLGSATALADTDDSSTCEGRAGEICWYPLSDWCEQSTIACRPIDELAAEEIWQCLGEAEPRFVWFSYQDEIDLSTIKYFDSDGNLKGVLQTDGDGGVAWGDYEASCLAPAPALISPWQSGSPPCDESTSSPRGCSTAPRRSPALIFCLSLGLLCLASRRQG